MAVGLNIDIVGDPTELTAFETRHVPGALKLSQEMGWPYRSEDWEFAARVGEGLVLERSGEVIGAAMWWNYGQAYASAGMIIVTASAQGGGYGSRLFNGLLEVDGRSQRAAQFDRRGAHALQAARFHRVGRRASASGPAERRRSGEDLRTTSGRRPSPTFRRSKPSTNGPPACLGGRWWPRLPMWATWW